MSRCCQNEYLGCIASGDDKDMSIHEKKCEYAPRPCALGCGKNRSRVTLKAHFEQDHKEALVDLACLFQVIGTEWNFATRNPQSKIKTLRIN